VLNGFTDVFSQSSSYPAADGTNQTTLHLVEKFVTSTGTASSGGTISSSRLWAGAIATFKAASVVSGLSLGGPAAGNYTLVGASGTATITPAPSTTTLQSSKNPSIQSSNVTVTAPVSSGVGTPSGVVVFLANGVAFSTNALVSGVAAASYNLLSLASNAISAQYAA
jgi:hypothetical protein